MRSFIMDIFYTKVELQDVGTVELLSQPLYGLAVGSFSTMMLGLTSHFVLSLHKHMLPLRELKSSAKPTATTWVAGRDLVSGQQSMLVQLVIYVACALFVALFFCPIMEFEITGAPQSRLRRISASSV